LIFCQNCENLLSDNNCKIPVKRIDIDGKTIEIISIAPMKLIDCGHYKTKLVEPKCITCKNNKNNICSAIFVDHTGLNIYYKNISSQIVECEKYERKY
jgi:hypothetical protein